MINKVHNENCMATMKHMATNYIDLTVTSPPYDGLRTYKKGIDISWNEEVWKPIIKELFRVTKEGGVVVWVVGDESKEGSESGTSFKQALWAVECGFKLFDTMIYKKNSFSNPSSNRYHQVFEYMFVFSKGFPKTFNPIKDKKNLSKKSGSCNRRKKDGTVDLSDRTYIDLNKYGQRTNIWKYNIGGHVSSPDKIAHKHPAIMPYQLAVDHILSWSNPMVKDGYEGDLIYDPFAGSGTTLLAARSNGRRWVGSEISDEYCDLIKKRLRNTEEPLC